MAALLTGRAVWWPVDKLILGYFAGVVALEIAYRSRISHAATLIGLHAAGALLIVLAARLPLSPLNRAFRHWYPLPYVAACYKEMSLLIPAVRRGNADNALAIADYLIWRAHPTVWLERFRSPLATEALQIVYSTFVPAVLLVAFLLWRQRRFLEFRYYAFLIALGFLVSYGGYLLVPARGPRFTLENAQTYELEGLWLFDSLRKTLDWIESAHFDCFPSGHTELTILACWGSRMTSANLFRLMIVYTLCVMLATVYLRYHYTIDVAAGAVAAGVLIVATPALYRRMGGEKLP